MNEEEFIKELSEANDCYFEKHFLNKDINFALYETIMEGLKMLLKAYTKLVFLENSIIAIKTNKPFWKKLDSETKSKIKFMLKGVKMINKDIKNILSPIAKGLKE